MRQLRRITAAWLVVCAPAAFGQPAPAPAFEVASVKLYDGPFRPPTFPLDNGDAFTQTGGRFTADFPLLTYIQFAYKYRFSEQQRAALQAHLPVWILTDRYDLQARADAKATKDQMRLMMQSLLAERFHLAVHFETRDTAVLAMELVKAGKTGPKLKPHDQGPPCDSPAAAAARGELPAVFPERCDVQALMMRPNRLAVTGSRNTTLELFAEAAVGLGRLDRPVVDRTGLSGRFDYQLEFVPEPGAPGAPPSDDTAPDGPNFLEALRQQLGIKLEPARAPVRVLVIDHVERPTGN